MIHKLSPDGQWGVIKAIDLPPGCARSKTRDTPDEALAATVEPTLTSKPGPGSLNKYVKVSAAEYMLRSRVNSVGQPKVTVPAPEGYVVRKSAFDKPAKVIPDYPHKCNLCGGPTLELFSSIEHPGPCEPKKARRK